MKRETCACRKPSKLRERVGTKEVLDKGSEEGVFLLLNSALCVRVFFLDVSLCRLSKNSVSPSLSHSLSLSVCLSLSLSFSPSLSHPPSISLALSFSFCLWISCTLTHHPLPIMRPSLPLLLGPPLFALWAPSLCWCPPSAWTRKKTNRSALPLSWQVVLMTESVISPFSVPS